MRISSSDNIAGVPILLVRKLLRHLALIQWPQKPDLFARLLEVSDPNPVIRELMARGYLRTGDREGWAGTYTITNGTGMALAFASAARPLHRATAERTLAAFLERVKQLNRDPYYLMRVWKVVLFGSMLDSTKDRLSDIDLSIRLEPRAPTWDTHKARVRRRIHEERQRGRRFDSFSDEMSWDTWEAMLMLKARKRSLSFNLIQSKNTEDWLAGLPHRVIFQAGWKSQWPVRA